jgi:multidrug transporter EmrE-like cation transporter
VTITTGLILLWVLIATVADMHFKAARSWDDPSFWIGVVLYAFTGGLALLTFKRVDFGSVVVIWIATSLLLGILVSVLWYRERFTCARALALLATIIAMALAGNE